MCIEWIQEYLVDLNGFKCGKWILVYFDARSMDFDAWNMDVGEF